VEHKFQGKITGISMTENTTWPGIERGPVPGMYTPEQGRDSGDEHEHCDRRQPQTIDDLREERRQKSSLLTVIREMRADVSRAQRCLDAIRRNLDELEEAVGPR
jgi:hypothetical protein